MFNLNGEMYKTAKLKIYIYITSSNFSGRWLMVSSKK